MDSWWGLKKKLENDFLCEKLKGRIEYFRTMYRPKTAHDKEEGYYTGRMCVLLDKKEVFIADEEKYFKAGYGYPTEGNIHQSYNSITPRRKREYRKKYGFDFTDYDYENIKKVQIETANKDVVHYKDFRAYLNEFIDMDIKDAINNENPVFRMLAILDRRIGKRTLEKIKEEFDKQPEWLQFFYKLRFEVEDMPLKMVD